MSRQKKPIALNYCDSCVGRSEYMCNVLSLNSRIIREKFNVDLEDNIG